MGGTTSALTDHDAATTAGTHTTGAPRRSWCVSGTCGHRCGGVNVFPVVSHSRGVTPMRFSTSPHGCPQGGVGSPRWSSTCSTRPSTHPATTSRPGRGSRLPTPSTAAVDDQGVRRSRGTRPDGAARARTSTVPARLRPVAGPEAGRRPPRAAGRRGPGDVLAARPGSPRPGHRSPSSGHRIRWRGHADVGGPSTPPSRPSPRARRAVSGTCRGPVAAPAALVAVGAPRPSPTPTSRVASRWAANGAGSRPRRDAGRRAVARRTTGRGPCRTRTGDICLAKTALYHLS